MGMNATDKLKSQGIDAKRDSQTIVNVFDIFVPTEGPLAHPRWDDPVNQALLDDIVERGHVVEEIVVRRDGVVDGKLRLTLIDGSQRVKHLRLAVETWQKTGVFRPEMNYIPVRFFTGNDNAALKERLKKNSDPFKRPDSPEVLSKTARQLTALREPFDDILAVMPREIGKGELEALLRWDDLSTEVQAKFNAGASVGLLPVVLDAPRETQVDVLSKLMDAGMKHSKGATRMLNRERKQASAQASTEGGDKTKDTGAVVTGRVSAPKSSAPKGERVHPKTLAKMRDACAHLGFGKAETPEDYADDLEELARAARAEGVALGMSVALGEKTWSDMPEELKKAVARALTPEPKKPRTPKGEKK
jgi:hypothetical protein